MCKKLCNSTLHTINELLKSKLVAIQLDGPWDKGYALDLHTTKSTYLGDDQHGNPRFDTEYTDIGKLLNRLKYRNDKSTIPGIIRKICNSVTGIEKFDYIIAIPPSNIERVFQPVFVVCEALSEALNVKYIKNLLAKKESTEELKSIADPVERNEILTGNYMLQKKIDLSAKDILLIDDLYRSGATLASAAEFLYNRCKVNKVSVLTLTKTRSNR